jgi:L-Ala-D/L-Glu epimerase
VKIDSLHCSRVEIALHETFRTAIRETDSISALRVVVAAGDKVGVGYATATPAITGDTVEGIESLINDVVAPYVVGRDLVETPTYVLGAQSSALFGIDDRDYALWTKQCSSGMAGVDLALHDLAFGSLDHMRSGSRASLVTSVTIGAGSIEDMVATAHRRVAAGFRVIKAKLGADPANDARRLIALAQALGAIRRNGAGGASGGVQFWVDANQGWTVTQALEVFDAALDANVVLGVFEQPTPAADIDGLREVRLGVQQRCAACGVAVVPVVADESARTLADVDRIIESGAADAINVKFMKFGGPTGSGIAVAKARTAGLGVLVGSMMEHPHSVAAAVRFASSLSSMSSMSSTSELESLAGTESLAGIESEWSWVPNPARRLEEDPLVGLEAKRRWGLPDQAWGPAAFTVHDLDAAWWAKDTSPLVYADGIVSVA